MYEYYLPVIVSALVVLLLGWLNPKALQVQDSDEKKGHTSYLWLSLSVLIVGVIGVWWLKERL